ncbi:MAG: folate/biopterin family MFS transporter [Pseudanabaenaceae cyanobacterium]
MLIPTTWSQRLRLIDFELVAIALIYFVQGALGLSQLAVSFFLKDDLHLSPAETASLVGIAMIPWTIKPLYGLISDGVPLWGYRRRPYLLLSSLLGVMAWWSMAWWVHSATWAVVAIATGSLGIACADAIIDALVVQKARHEGDGDAGSLQSFGWAWVSIGAIASSWLSGYLLAQLGARGVFLITGFLPLLVAMASLAIKDSPVQQGHSLADSFKENLLQIKQAVSDRKILLPVAFIFLWQATPSADSAFFYFTTNELGFTPEFLGTVRLATSIAGLLGVWLFQTYLKHIPLRKIFWWTTVIATLLGLTSLILVNHWNRPLGISDRWFSLGDSLIMTIAGRIAFMPVLVLAARLCPHGIEATLFALLMSAINVSSLISYQLGAGLTYILGVTETDFTNLWLLVTITNLSSLLPLPLIHWLPAERLEIGDQNAEELIVPAEMPTLAKK